MWEGDVRGTGRRRGCSLRDCAAADRDRLETVPWPRWAVAAGAAGDVIK